MLSFQKWYKLFVDKPDSLKHDTCHTLCSHTLLNTGDMRPSKHPTNELNVLVQCELKTFSADPEFDEKEVQILGTQQQQL